MGGGGEMFSVLASCAVDRGFEPQSAQIKDYENVICCFSAFRRKTGYLGIRIMYTSEATCLSAINCFSELALYNSG